MRYGRARWFKRWFPFGTASTPVIPAAAYIVTLAAEVRSFAVLAESRRVVVPAESRVVIAPVESRVVAAEA